jgi:thiamine biosynthesis protein ThiS
MKVKQFSIIFFFNGEKYNLQTFKVFSIHDLLKFFNYKQSLVVLEYNGKIIPSTMWSKIYLKNKDKLEIVTIVGGG